MSLTSLSSLSSQDEEETISRRRTNAEKIDAFEKYDEVQFKMRFRLSKETVVHLCSLFGEKIQPLTKRNRAIQPIDQLLIALRFFATGSHQRVIGDIFLVEQPTVHRIVHRVATELAKLQEIYFKMPTSSEHRQIAKEFYTIAGFPRVIGAVGCTHIKIKSPGGMQAETFRNTKGFFSLNVQMVCDTRLMVNHIIARWPGSVQNSKIFNDSPLCAQFERGDYGNMFLLGDSSYPCRRYLLTPLRNTSTPAEEAYNRAQISTRNPVERLFGVLKRRFPCLQAGLQVKVENVSTIIVACTVLHNIALSRQDFMEQGELDTIEMSSAQESASHTENENFCVRNSLINAFFTNYNLVLLIANQQIGMLLVFKYLKLL